MSNNKTYLFLLTIGPVQAFIAQARKTVDLYAGSKILTELTKTGIAYIGRKKIIFPYAKYEIEKGWEDVNSLPNRFVAKLSGTENEINQLGKDTENAIRAKFKSISENALKNAGIPTFPAFEQQIEQHLDIYWAAIELGTDYKKTYEKLEQVIGSLKNMRQFQQYTYDSTEENIDGTGEKGRKCSIDGERNAIIYRENPEKKKPFALSSQAKPTNYKFDEGEDFNYKLDEGEALSAVSYTKRAYQVKYFPSTASIALMHVHHILKNDGLAKICYGLLKRTNDQLFFKENIEREDYLKQVIREANGNSPLTPTSIRNCHKNYWDIAKEKGFKSSDKHKYYAVLTFDGDSMGKWLGGANVNGSLEAFHEDFSKYLSAFAKKADEIVKREVKGYTVYAGGDDYLGFVNINHLFGVLQELQEAYKTEVSNPLATYRKDDKEITFSAGICIAHYKEPLRLVLQQAHAMMDKAKDIDDNKNCFGISVIKGSGENLETVWKNEHIGLLKEITEGLMERENKDIPYFSDKYIKVLETEFQKLVDEDNKLEKDSSKLLIAEIKRTLTRAVNNGTKEKKQDVVKTMSAALDKLHNANLSNLPNFFSALNFCRFMQRELCHKTFFNL